MTNNRVLPLVMRANGVDKGVIMKAMKRLRAGVLASFLVACCAVSVCASQRSAFENARSQDTISAYQNFLSQYPKSKFAPQARARVSELQEIEFTKDFEATKRTDTIADWNGFLQKNGTASNKEAQIGEAKDRRDTLLVAQFDAEKSRPKLQDFLKNHADSRLSAQVQARLDACQTNTVVAPGEVLWTSTYNLDRTTAVYVLDVTCSWKEGAIKRKDPDPTQNSLLNNMIRGDTRFGELFADTTSDISNQNPDFAVPYPLRFSQPTDRVMIWKSPIFGDKLVVLEGSPNIHENVKQDASANMTLFLSIQVAKDPNVLYVSGGQFVSATAIEGNTISMHSGSQAVDSGPALVDGKITLPHNDWVTVKRGIEARDGEIIFETNRVFLSPGTSVVRYPDSPGK
jgi:hypothetical protein